METILFAIFSVLLIIGYIHEDWFIDKENKAARLAAALLGLLCKKILQILCKCGKLKQTKRKEEHHARHIERIQGFGASVRQQTGEWNTRRAG